MRVVSLYVHVPFCTRRCSYCSFYHVQTITPFETDCIDALLAELDAAFEDLGDDVVVGTVFVGGGTPSVLKRESLERLFAAIQQRASAEMTREVTVELNPEDVTDDLLGFLDETGVTRVSLGVQSMHPLAQKVLKRCTPEENVVAIERVLKRFDNVSFDVLLGIPGRDRGDIEDTIDRLVDYRPQHFSVYCLEPGGDMGEAVEKFFSAVDPERSADEYMFVANRLVRAGYRHYEVSNFALSGHESHHNRVYWSGAEYLGVGPGAHSMIAGRRFYNVPSLADYLDARGMERISRRIFDDADPDAAALETMMLGLRTADGVALDNIPDAGDVDALCADGLAYVEDGRLKLNAAGFLVSNEIVLRLADGRSK